MSGQKALEIKSNNFTLSLSFALASLSFNFRYNLNMVSFVISRHIKTVFSSFGIDLKPRHEFYVENKCKFIAKVLDNKSRTQ